MTNKKRKRLSSPQIAILGFAGLILLGALLLMLPISSAENVVTPFTDALFTSTTSVCVTGLIVKNTGEYWSLFGQSVIMILIQIGGLGVVTVAASLAMLSGRKIGLFQRSTMQDAVAAQKISGIVKLTGFILKYTFLFEFIGAIIMAPVFIKDFGPLRGIWFSFFHSVSAFCNAGIDLLGMVEPYSSFTHYISSPAINVAIMGLTIIGGLGFLTWDDIRTYGIKFKKYRLQSKIVLVTSALLILIPAIGFYFFEFSDLPFNERIWASLFQSVTPRTSGFNSVDLASMSESGQMTIILLMLIGGSPGSTAGGMKTTTFAVLILCAIANFKKKDEANAFGRRISKDIVYTAATILFMYTAICVGSAILISFYEGLPMMTCLYETASAVATVGLTLGLTPQLSDFSKWVLMILMYIGRVGGLTLIYSLISKNEVSTGKLPLERITVG